jgi:hypothetical protein
MLPLHRLLLCLRVVTTQPGSVQGLQSRQAIIWIRPAEKIPNFSPTTGTVVIFDPFSCFLEPTSRTASAFPNHLHERWAQPPHMTLPVALPKSGVLPRLAQEFDQ